MKPLVLAGLLILAIQCVLVVTVYWPQSADRQAESMETFAGFDGASIDEIFVGDEYDNETLLKKVGDRWLLPELEDLPADTAMIDKLLDALTGDETQWPVADSIAARQRFQVAPYYYQRRIRLLGDNQLQGTFFLGKSPGFRKVHIRNADQDAIYSISFNAYDAPGHSGAWLDRKLLINRCDDCGHFHHPPKPVCPDCWSKSLTPSAASTSSSMKKLPVHSRLSFVRMA